MATLINFTLEGTPTSKRKVDKRKIKRRKRNRSDVS